MRKPFIWWRINQYGCAEGYDDTPEIRARVDANPHGWYGSIEGCINNGVQATAFKRTTHETYDAHVWLTTGERVRAGSVTITEITAPLGDKRTWQAFAN